MKQSEEWEAVKMSILSIELKRANGNSSEYHVKETKKGHGYPQIAKDLETDESVIREIIAGLESGKGSEEL